MPSKKPYIVVRLDARFAEKIDTYATSEHRTMKQQIEYWADKLCPDTVDTNGKKEESHVE